MKANGALLRPDIARPPDIAEFGLTSLSAREAFRIRGGFTHVIFSTRNKTGRRGGVWAHFNITDSAPRTDFALNDVKDPLHLAVPDPVADGIGGFVGLPAPDVAGRYSGVLGGRVGSTDGFDR